MQGAWLLIWPLQGVLMFFDEFYFHHKRGLTRWERIGHPIDTFSFLACFVFCLLSPPNESNIPTFILLSSISTLIIVKDEWLHIKKCEIGEHILHVFLFMAHPLALLALYLEWVNTRVHYIGLTTATVFFFMLYQIYYWIVRRP